MSKVQQKQDESFNKVRKMVLDYVHKHYSGQSIEASVSALAHEIKAHTKTSVSISKLTDAVNRCVGRNEIKLVKPQSDKKAHTNSKTTSDGNINQVPSNITEEIFPGQLAGRVEKDKLGRYILVPLSPKYKDETIYIHDSDAVNYLGKIVGARILKSQDFHDAATIIRPIEERNQTALISRILAMAFDAGIDPTPNNTVNYIMKSFPRLKIVWDDIQLEKQNLPQDWSKEQKDKWENEEWHRNLDAYLNSDEKLPQDIVIELAQTAAVEYIPNTKLLFKLLDGLNEYEPNVSKPDLNQRVLDLRDILEELKTIPTKVTENDPNDPHSIENMKKKCPNFMDLRDPSFVTIDPITCLDMDDAVYVEKLPNGGYIQYTAISLVSEYIKPLGALFNAALKRCNSTYFADMVAPMLMPVLSNIIGSLNAGEDRLAFITKIEYDSKGNIVNTTIGPGAIKSRHKFAYEDVDKIFSKDEAERSKHSQEVLNSLDALLELENILRPMREESGSSKFRTREVTYRLNALRDAVEQAFADNSTKAHEAVETCMLSANKEFARWARENDIPIMWRDEESIKPEKIERIKGLLTSLNLPFNVGEIVGTYGELQLAVNEAIECAYQKGGELFANVVSENIIQCFPKAHYEPNNIGHFALNFEEYAHTTSPIRRLSDLINQMQACAFMAGQPLPFTEEDIKMFSTFCNICEQNSEDFENQSDDLLHAHWLKQKIAQEDLTTEGYISRVDEDLITLSTNYGKVVIPLHPNGEKSSFTCASNNLSITHNVTGLVYKMGQQLLVRPTDVDLNARLVTAEIVRTQSQNMVNYKDPIDEHNNFKKHSQNITKEKSQEKPKETIVETFDKDTNYMTHVHTSASDGEKDLHDVVKDAADKNACAVGPADHHQQHTEALEEFGVTLDDTKLAYFPLDLSCLGEEYKDKKLYYINMTEVTARDEKILNVKGNSAKYHFLIVGAPIGNQSSPLTQLLHYKRKNDIDYNLAPIAYIFRYVNEKTSKNLPFPEKELEKFQKSLLDQGFDPTVIRDNDAVSFFEQNPHLVRDLGLNMRIIKKMLRCIPTVRRLNIPAKIWIDAAHAEGALALVAHPGRNLKRVDDVKSAIEHLIELGIDGFNIKEYPHPEINKLIKKICASANTPNKLITDFGGPDCHTLEDYDNVNLKPFTIGNSRVFFKELEALQQARLSGKPTHRQNNPDIENLHQFIKDIKARANGLDYYQAFKEKVDEMLEVEKLKDTYSIESILESVEGTASKEIIDFLKSRKSITPHEARAIIKGTFVPPKSSESEKDEKRKMVSKDAAGSHNGGKLDK